MVEYYRVRYFLWGIAKVYSLRKSNQTEVYISGVLMVVLC